MSLDAAAEAIAHLMYNSAGHHHIHEDRWLTDPPNDEVKALWIKKSMELVVAAEPHIRRATYLSAAEAMDRAKPDSDELVNAAMLSFSGWLREQAKR